MEIYLSFLVAIVVLLLVRYDQMAMSLTDISSDQSALASFLSHLHLNPSRHILFKNWSAESASVCDWIGVTCGSRHLRVAALDLSMMGLTGTLVPHLGNLSFLVSLNLSGNNFQGVVPLELVRLRRLRMVDFSYNAFGGEIPKWFGSLSRLQALYLRNNTFSGFIPPSIFNASQLEALDLSLNPLQGQIPQQIGNLLNLKMLLFQYNQLDGFVPWTLFNLSNMETLSLLGNSLSGNLPSNMCRNLPRLVRLSLTGNNMYGQIPSNLSGCSQIQVLSLTGNKFDGHIPSGMGRLSMLEKLHLTANDLTGAIPEELGNLTILKILVMSENRLAGPIPPQVLNISSLQFLYIEQNNLSGMLPDNLPKGLVNLPSLQALSLSSNNIRGTVPNTICKWQNLNVLDLSDNQIYGAIPGCVGNITTLRYFLLDSNKLNGGIPSSFWNLRDILYLNLSSNSLVGSLAPEIANLKAAIKIDLSLNRFSDIIPSAIGDMQSLSFFDLSNNELQGTIPELLSNMISLETLDLSHNGLSGVIPKSLEKLQLLTSLNVSFNSLSGEIPFNSTFKNITFESFMFNKGLCGDPKYHVPPCRDVEKPNSKLRVLLISLATSLAILAMIFAYGIARYRRKVETLVPGIMQSLFEGTHFRVSYYELLAATNRYNESNLLGSGGFGSVYKGTLRDGTDVAVKVFNLHLENAFKSFEVECEVLKNLRHRNLCKVIGCCSNPDFKALVLEYMPCGSLEKWLYSHNHFLDMNQRISILIDVACALEYLHQGYSQPVIHCDLKPSNILLDQDMNAHLCDFGVAKLLGDGESVVQTTTLATLSYTAPEYGTGGFVSAKCDVFSYGVILMEVFTRRRPTDEIFTGNLSLRSWVKHSMHNDLVDIVDSNLLTPEGGDHGSNNQMLDCLASLMELALNCSVESPRERMSIKDVIAALNKIKLQLLLSSYDAICLKS